MQAGRQAGRQARVFGQRFKHLWRGVGAGTAVERGPGAPRTSKVLIGDYGSLRTELQLAPSLFCLLATANKGDERCQTSLKCDLRSASSINVQVGK